MLFHAILHLSAFRLEQKYPQRSHVLSSQLMGECVRLLRDRVEDAGVGLGVSDQTISAVATLAGIEVCSET